MENNSQRNPDWTRDELILALNLYFKMEKGKMNKTDSRVIELSQLLRTLPIHKKNDIGNLDTFRNVNGFAMKLGNIKGYDPTTPGGLRKDKGVERIWEEFYENQDELHAIAQSIWDNHKVGEYSYKKIKLDIQIDENLAAPEGVLNLKKHFVRERNSKIVRTKKKQFKKKYGILSCEACNFNFESKYGSLGTDYIECHHTIPISSMEPGEKTKLKDLVLLCANCHRMVHRSKKKILSLKEIKNIIKN